MQVTYAAELREYLARSFSELTIVTFEKLVFEGIQQETVLLLGVRGNGQDSARIGWLELEDMADLHPTAIEMTEHKPAQLNHARDKWTRYYLSRPELDLLQAFELCGQFSPLSDIAQVDVGVVTGRNEFFVLRPSQAAELGLTEHCVPLVGRSAQIPGLLLRKADWAALADEDAKCLLLQLGSNERSMLDPAALAYVERGERLGLDEGYKCRIRKPRWWRVPSAYSPDAFLLRQINDAPRIVLNAANCTSTDTIHRVRVNPGTNTEALAVASINSVTLAFSEILGRSYGGGVLELEPSEADALPFPILRGGLGDALPEVNGVLIAEGIRSASRMVDALVAETLGLPLRDFERASAIWATLSRRRVNRKPSSRVARLVA
jgi:adenine-specific DNA methylase